MTTSLSLSFRDLIAPTAEEMAERMKLPVEKLESCTAQAAAAQTLSFEEMVMDSGFDIAETAVFALARLLVMTLSILCSLIMPFAAV